MAAISKPLVVFIPDTRGVLVEKRYGKGNLKIGMNVYSYSRLPGLPNRAALGSASPQLVLHGPHTSVGTCPGATEECLEICYAARPVAEAGAVFEMWQRNTATDDVPPIPEDATMLRLHVSGDFNSDTYILNWIDRLTARPDVTAWVYTKSWRSRRLLPYLERLRALPNVQMFASMDKSNPDQPPAGWRRAWIDGDPRAGKPLLMRSHGKEVISKHNLITFDGTPTYICPEETKRRENCEQCGYCLRGNRNDVTFLEH